MTERESARLSAWNQQLTATHQPLRDALDLTLTALADGADVAPVARDLLLFCRGFCAALTGHHRGEDQVLFPAIAAAHPHLAPVLASLSQDHSTIAYLLAGLDAAAQARAEPDELQRHLEGVAAIMESHFAHEERQLLTVLETLALDADTRDVMGPLWTTTTSSSWIPWTSTSTPPPPRAGRRCSCCPAGGSVSTPSTTAPVTHAG